VARRGGPSSQIAPRARGAHTTKGAKESGIPAVSHFPRSAQAHAAATGELTQREGIPPAPLQHLQPPLACNSDTQTYSADIRARAPDCPTSIIHARKSCNFDPCISAFAARIMQFRPATATRRCAHLFTSPLSCRRKRMQGRQGERGRILGLHGQPRGCWASGILRGRAQEAARLPFGPATSPQRPSCMAALS
jgi:hypothetical protein